MIHGDPDLTATRADHRGASAPASTACPAPARSAPMPPAIASSGRQAAVFLDRDGVINEDRGFVHRSQDFAFLPGAVAAMKRIQQTWPQLVVVTNQSGIGRELYDERAFLELTQWMLAALGDEGVRLTGVYYCPHLPAAGCGCRKPAPGMILQAAQEHPIDLSASWLVGDRASDLEAAQRAGIPHRILIADQDPDQQAPGTRVCRSLEEAAGLISSERTAR